MQPQKKNTNFNWRIMVYVAAALLLVVAILVLINQLTSKNNNQKTTQKPIYSLSIISPKAFVPNQATSVTFDIRDQNQNVLKDFEIAHEKQMHIIVVRKDRSQFQHLHPTLNASTGVFTLENFLLPTDGEYRIFADFVPGKIATSGSQEPVTPYVDVVAGDVSKYHPKPQEADKLTSTVDGFATEITFPHRESPGTTFWAKNENTFAVDIKQNGLPFTKLEKYLGALGHMVALGPNLEYVHVHTLSDDPTKQDGMLYFGVNFPEVGRYQIYLQTQTTAGKVTTFDYTVTAKAMPSAEQHTDNANHGH